MSCRLTGSIVFGGVSAYALLERARLPPSAPGRRTQLGIAAVFGVLAVVRGIGFGPDGLGALRSSHKEEA